MKIYALEFLEGEIIQIYLSETFRIKKRINLNEKFKNIREEVIKTEGRFYYRESGNSRPHWLNSERGRVPEVINSKLESLVRIILNINE